MDHVFVLYDRATQSVWYPGEDQTLQAVGGLRKGMSVPFLDEPAPVTLAAWLEQHPDSTVLLPSEEDAAEWKRARLGVGIARAEGGIRVTRISEGSGAEAAGLRVDDVLVSIAGTPVTNRNELRDVLSGYAVGDTIEVEILRTADGVDAPDPMKVSLTFLDKP